MTKPISRMRTLFAVVLLSFTVSACGYNNIPTLEEQAKAKWADVQNNYQPACAPPGIHPMTTGIQRTRIFE